MERFEQLDSIRGIAAFIVFLNHILLVLPILAGEVNSDNWFVNLLRHSPLSILWGGQQAVLIFFLLSGFVLSLAFYNNPPKYKSFLIKRFFRLYIPYIVVLLLSIVLVFFFHKNNINGGSNWVDTQWTQAITLKSILVHIIFILNFNTHAFDPPIWSLVHEMRISIVFPIIMYFTKRFGWKTIFGAFGLSLIGFELSKLSLPSTIDYFITLHYASIFILGALLAMYSERVIKWYKSIQQSIKYILFILCLLLLSYPYWFMPNINGLHSQLVNDWISAIGGLILISTSLSSTTLIRFLKNKYIHYMGKISFSFYLTHFVVLLTLLYTFSTILPIWLIWILTFVVTVSLSSLSYIFVEKTSIRVGKKLANLNKKIGNVSKVNVG